MATTLNKFAGEARTYRFNFNGREEIRNFGDTISSVNSISGSPSGLTIGGGTIGSVASAGMVLCAISGGTSGTTYTLTCLVSTSAGAILEDQGFLQVN